MQKKREAKDEAVCKTSFFHRLDWSSPGKVPGAFTLTAQKPHRNLIYLKALNPTPQNLKALVSFASAACAGFRPAVAEARREGTRRIPGEA